MLCDSISRLSRLLYSGCNSLRAKYYGTFIGRKHRELNWALWSLWVNGLCPSDIGQFSFHIHPTQGRVCHISRMGDTLEFVRLSLLDLQSYYFNMRSQFYLSTKRQPTFTYTSILFTFLYKTNIYTDKQKRNWISVHLKPAFFQICRHTKLYINTSQLSEEEQKWGEETFKFSVSISTPEYHSSLINTFIQVGTLSDKNRKA